MASNPDGSTVHASVALNEHICRRVCGGCALDWELSSAAWGQLEAQLGHSTVTHLSHLSRSRLRSRSIKHLPAWTLLAPRPTGGQPTYR